jgi:hypothetical protein
MYERRGEMSVCIGDPKIRGEMRERKARRAIQEEIIDLPDSSQISSVPFNQRA